MQEFKRPAAGKKGKWTPIAANEDFTGGAVGRRAAVLEVLVPSEQLDKIRPFAKCVQRFWAQITTTTLPDADLEPASSDGGEAGAHGGRSAVRDDELPSAPIVMHTDAVLEALADIETLRVQTSASLLKLHQDKMDECWASLPTREEELYVFDHEFMLPSLKIRHTFDKACEDA